jgi:STE24 endopeptidase
MQVTMIGIFVTLFAYGPFFGNVRWPAEVNQRLILVALAGWFLPKLLLGMGYWLACRRTARRLPTEAGPAAHRRLDRLTTLTSLILLPLFLLDLSVGALELTRWLIGDLILIDELIVMTPTLGLLVWSWWSYYPIDRALREAMILRCLDEGQPVYPIWSAGQFVLAQVRHQMLLFLLPLLAVLAWSETVDWLGPGGRGVIGLAAVPWLVAAGAGVIFLFTPVVIRHVWDTQALPDGEVRRRLDALCDDYRVKVRELLLWRTFGGMANAAVLGLVPGLRYILLSDALLDRASAAEVEAVMAHELAHVKKKHMPWLMAAAIGLAGLLETSVYIGANVAWQATGWEPNWLLLGFAAPAAVGWFYSFGWVSRRVERQADSFAVRHLALRQEEPTRDAAGRVLIDRGSVATMVAALGQVARLNHVRIKRKSWRHGSIAWRQAYLQSLVGAPAERLRIDRLMWVVNAASVIMIGVVVWWTTR